MMLQALLSTLTPSTRLDATVDLRVVVALAELDEKRLSALSPAQACELALCLGFQNREARHLGKTIEALNSITGAYTPLFPLH